MKKFSLIVENNKELKDFITIFNHLNATQKFTVKIILLSEIYQDKSQVELLKNIAFSYELLIVKSHYNKHFLTLNLLEKSLQVLQAKKAMFDFIQDCQILFSGVQTVFERVLFCQIKKYKLPIKTIVYHRHLIFDEGVGTQPKGWKNSNLIQKLFKIAGLDGFLIATKSVGFADEYMVLGNINKQYLMTYGVNEKNIHPLGSLEYDDIDFDDKPIQAKKAVCYITAACEWIGDEQGERCQQQKIKAYLDFFAHYLHEYDVWIRIHPRENKDKYLQLQEKYPFLQLQYPNVNNPLLKDLSQFNMLVGGASTVLFEASVLSSIQLVFFLLTEEIFRIRFLESQKIPYVIKLDNDILNKNLVFGLKNAIKYEKNEKTVDRISNFIIRIISS